MSEHCEGCHGTVIHWTPQPTGPALPDGPHVCAGVALPPTVQAIVEAAQTYAVTLLRTDHTKLMLAVEAYNAQQGVPR